MLSVVLFDRFNHDSFIGCVSVAMESFPPSSSHQQQQQQPPHHHQLPGYLLDLQNLRSAWLHIEDDISFSRFKQLWRSFEFSYIHKGTAPCYESSSSVASSSSSNGSSTTTATTTATLLSDLEYTKALFAATQVHLSPTSSFMARVWAIYCLYCLYRTQLAEPKRKIPVNMCTTLSSIDESIVHSGYSSMMMMMDGVDGISFMATYGSIVSRCS